MTTIILAAFLTVAVTAWLIHPLMKGEQQIKALMILGAMPLVALGLYLWQGQPDMPSAAALFEHDGSRAILRALAKDELYLTQALSQDPENHDLRQDLGEVFYARALAILAEEGDRERAVAYMDSALSVAPQDAPYLGTLRADHKKQKK